MTQSIDSSTAVLPQQPVSMQSPPAVGCSTPPPAYPASAIGVAPTGAPTTTGGGALDAAQGAGVAASPELVAALQQLAAALQQLVPYLQQVAANGQLPGAVAGGGAPAAAGGCGCGMAGCTHGAGMASPPGQGAMGAPTADAAAGAEQAARRHGSGAGATPGPGGNVDPSSVRDKTGTAGLTGPSLRGLEEAHGFGLPLVSGKRGGSTKSDHFHGNAIDVSTLPIGAASSTEGTPQMKAFAEHMRQAGQRGQLDVKYVILDGKIASATDNWTWREYRNEGRSREALEALKQSNRGEYNRIQHYDHVHVSFG